MYIGRLRLSDTKRNSKGTDVGTLLPEASTCDKHLYIPMYANMEQVGASQSTEAR